MAISFVRIDGQNIGVTATNGDAVYPIALDMDTGELFSGQDSSGANFLTDLDLRNLRSAVDALFVLMPVKADRIANAAGLLQQLINVSFLSTGASLGIPLTAELAVGDIWSLKVNNPAAVTSILILHLPHSIEGAFSFAAGNNISNTAGGGGVAAVTASAPLASSGGANPDISLNGIVDLAHGGSADDLSAASDGVVTLDSGLSKMVVAANLSPVLNSRGVTGLDSVARSGAVTIDPASSSTWFVDTTAASSTISTSFATWWTKGVSMTMAVYVAGDAVNTLTYNVEAGATVQWLGGAAPAWYPGPSALGAGVNGVLFLTNIQNGASKIIIASWQTAA